jgi:hypothetical protein
MDNKQALNALYSINPKAANRLTIKQQEKRQIIPYAINNTNSIYKPALDALYTVNPKAANRLNEKQQGKLLPYNNNLASLQLKDNLVSVRLRNGLGNRIFQVFAAQGYAEKFNKHVVICKDMNIEGNKSHEQNTDINLLRIFPNLKYVSDFYNYTTIQEREYFKYTNLPNYQSNVLLNGYFQCPQYFPSNRVSIKNSYYKNTYFIHIRGGDYLHYENEWGFNILKYYKKCFNQIDPSINYIVFSNDNVYAESVMRNFNISYKISDIVDPVDTLIKMANCAGGICVNSSFGWLGAFFQGNTRGKVFMPSIWNNYHDCKGIYPEWAKIIDVESINNLPIRPLAVKQNNIQAEIVQQNNIQTVTNNIQAVENNDKVTNNIQAVENNDKVTNNIQAVENTGKVTVVLSGGLGNQLFQLFAGIVYANKYNKKYVICKAINQDAVKEHEKNIHQLLIQIFPDLQFVDSFDSYTEIREKRHMEFDELPYVSGNVLIRGYFQIERYASLLPYIPNIRTNYYENTYFIHIRLTDYVGFFGMDYDKTKYHKNCFRLLGSNAKYIIFSDDNYNAELYIRRFNINYKISNKTDALETLIEMANCAGGICANSTFSWMGAFFQRQPRGKIFFPNRWVLKQVNGIFPSWATRVDS